MPDREKPRRELSEQELESESAGELPDREALSVLDANIAIPIDPSIAADVLAGEDPPEPDQPEPDQPEPGGPEPGGPEPGGPDAPEG